MTVKRKTALLGGAMMLAACGADAGNTQNSATERQLAMNAAAMAAPVVTKAKAAVKQGGLKPYQQKLAEEAWETANGKCRGGSGDDNNTYVFCNIRALLDYHVLTPNNRCFHGSPSDPGPVWRACASGERTTALDFYEEGGPAYSAPPLTRAYLSTRVHFNNPMRAEHFQQRNCEPGDQIYWGGEAFLHGNVYGQIDSDDFGIILPWTERFFVIVYWNESEETEGEADPVGFTLAERCS